MPPTFAHRLRLIPHRSLLLERARRAGLDGAAGFVALAWQRGCRYYPRGEGEVPAGSESLSNEELAIALMHPSLPWDPQRLRVAAAMAGASGNDCRRLARLAVQEQAVVPHLFEEFQVILRPDWHENIVPITHPELSRLTVSLRRRVQPPPGAYRASIIWTAPAMERVLRASPCPARLPIPSTTSTLKTTRPSRSATGSTRGRRRHISATSSSARSTGR